MAGLGGYEVWCEEQDGQQDGWSILGHQQSIELCGATPAASASSSASFSSETAQRCIR